MWFTAGALVHVRTHSAGECVGPLYRSHSSAPRAVCCVTNEEDEVSSPEFGRGLSGFIARQGVSRPLIWGFVALTLFMVGDGIELSFLSTYLTDQGLSLIHISEPTRLL